MNIIEKTDEEILAMATPLWRDLVKYSNEGKYGDFARNFSSTLARAIDQVVAGHQTRTNETLSYSGNKDAAGVDTLSVRRVVKALNADMPFDEFVRMQLAGDEFRPGNRDAIIATAYLALGEGYVLQRIRMRSFLVTTKYPIGGELLLAPSFRSVK